MKTIQCNKCQKVKGIKEFYYHRIRKKYMDSCKECNKKISIKYQHDRRLGNDAYKQIFMTRAAHIRRETKYVHSKLYNLPVADNLTDILRDLWIKQEGKCYYTNEPMQLSGYHEMVANAVTIDRQVPEKGYVEGNIVLCCSIINRMKQNATPEQLVSLCEKILQNKDKFLIKLLN